MRGSREEETGIFLGSPASECIRIGDLSFDEERPSLKTIRGEQFEKKKRHHRLRAGMGLGIACVRDSGTTAPLEQLFLWDNGTLCGSFMCTGLNVQPHQEKLSPFPVAQLMGLGRTLSC